MVHILWKRLYKYVTVGCIDYTDVRIRTPEHAVAPGRNIDTKLTGKKQKIRIREITKTM